MKTRRTNLNECARDLTADCELNRRVIAIGMPAPAPPANSPYEETSGAIGTGQGGLKERSGSPAVRAVALSRGYPAALTHKNHARHQPCQSIDIQAENDDRQMVTLPVEKVGT